MTLDRHAELGIGDATTVKTRPPLPGGHVRWAWRQLTSMRTALILLFLLAVAAVPGSLIPQRPVDPVAVATFTGNHPDLAAWCRRLSLFDVFAAPWFSAIYLLLMVSLLGCVIPRTRQQVRLLRSGPPPTPRHLTRLPAFRALEVHAPSSAVLDAAAAELRARRFRVQVARADGSVAAQRGYTRELGNLLFHVSLVLVLVGIALGHLYGFRGSALVIEGEGFSNTVTQFDNLRAGPFVDLDRLRPFAVTLDDFRAEYQDGGRQQGAARDFEARVSYRRAPGAVSESRSIRVNDPLRADGAKLYLGPHGYAPVVTIRDGDGNVAFRGPVPFLPMDPVGLASRGVVKVPDARPRQLGFQGFFLPTAALSVQRGPFSMFPAPRNPRLLLNVWTGDLGLDAGTPQSIYRLDTSRMTQLREGPGVDPLTSALPVGGTLALPNDLGSLTFDGYREWVVLQVNDDPGRFVALLGAALALAGLCTSLFGRPRRIWVRVRQDGPHSSVEIGGLARAGGADLDADLERLAAALDQAPTPAPTPIPQ